MTRYAALLAALLLPACSPAPQEAPAPAPAPPPPVSAPAFVGPWAVNVDYCAHSAWSFRADGISTPGEVSCRWDEAVRTADGWRLPSTCLSEGNTTTDPVDLTFEGPDAMTVKGGFWLEPIRLIRCPAP